MDRRATEGGAGLADPLDQLQQLPGRSAESIDARAGIQNIHIHLTPQWSTNPNAKQGIRWS
jgi:hypothetical protein